MDKGKYIIVLERGNKVAILFSSLIGHDTFLKCYCKANIVSAGFFEVYSDQDNHDYHCIEPFGKSTMLKIESHPEEDKKIIERFLNR